MKTWSAEELGQFLGAVREHRLGPLFTLLATSGLRRGEALGLRWSDVDLHEGRVSVRQTLLAVNNKVEFGEPKTNRSRRTVDLDPATLTVLKALRKAQLEERAEAGFGRPSAEAIVFADERGEPLHPNMVSRTFTRLVKEAGLPAIRLHDLRHTHATLSLQAGNPREDRVRTPGTLLRHDHTGHVLARNPGAPEGCGREDRRVDPRTRDAAVKFYVVTAPQSARGIYATWAECKARVHGVPDARYQSVDSRAKADAMLEEGITLSPGTYAFTDGNAAGGVGVVVIEQDAKTARVRHEVATSVAEVFADGTIRDLESERAVAAALRRLHNILAELGGLYHALQLVGPGTALTIVHDYKGVGMWMERTWRTKHPIVTEIIGGLPESGVRRRPWTSRTGISEATSRAGPDETTSPSGTGGPTDWHRRPLDATMALMNEGADRVDVRYVWPRTLVVPPRPPKLVYLDLNQWIALAKALAGHRDGGRYEESLDACVAAVESGRAVFPISDSIYFEVFKIGLHRQRHDLREVIEKVSGYRVVTSRSVISTHEIEALLDDLVGPSPRPINSMAYLDWGVARAFGMVGGFRVRDANGEDLTMEVRSKHPDGPEAFDRALVRADLELNRKSLEGPPPEEEPELRADGWDPRAAVQVSERRAAQEIEQVGRFNEDPSGGRPRGPDRDKRDPAHRPLRARSRARVGVLQRGANPARVRFHAELRRGGDAQGVLSP